MRVNVWRKLAYALAAVLATGAGYVGAAGKLDAEHAPPFQGQEEPAAEPETRKETGHERRRREGWVPGYERAVGSGSDEHAPPPAPVTSLPSVKSQVPAAPSAPYVVEYGSCDPCCGQTVVENTYSSCQSPCSAQRVVKPLRAARWRCR